MPTIPHHISPDRTYEARITEVYKSTSPGEPGAPGAGGSESDDNLFTYDADSVDSPDSVKVRGATPFRRIIRSNLSDRPKVIAARIGDPCRIDMHGGTPRLLEVLEQYIADDCVPTATADPVPTPTTPPIVVLPGPPDNSIPSN